MAFRSMGDYEEILEKRIRLELGRIFEIGEVCDLSIKCPDPLKYEKYDIEGRFSNYTQIVRCIVLIEHYRNCFPEEKTFDKMIGGLEKVAERQRGKLVGLMHELIIFKNS